MSEDILGLKSYGDALNKSVEGVYKVFSIVCKPVLEELGQMAKDKVRVWRLNNIHNILEKANSKFEYKDGEIDLKINPKVALAIIENGANEDNEDLQEMWAGLLASSPSKDGLNDENIIYVNVLKQISSIEVKILKYVCEHSRKFEPVPGILGAYIEISEETLIALTGISDFNQLESIFNHLYSLLLFKSMSGIFADFNYSNFHFKNNSKALTIGLNPTALAFNLYFRCIGFKGSIQDYLKEQNSK